MSSSDTSSPLSMVSPHALAPATSSMVNKHVVSMSVSLQTPAIFTNKEWIVPPRPKPGRKPAADTPPTKRKAQNRAAQRAFRERRAARVGDLEEQMRQMEDEDEREQAELRARIKQLETEVEKYSKLVISWREKYQELEARCAREKELRTKTERECGDLRAGRGSTTDAVSLPLKHAISQLQDLDQKCDINENIMDDDSNEVPMGCGNCSKDSRCECIEQAFDIANVSADMLLPPSKRPLSPLSVTDSKRSRHGSFEPELEDENDEMNEMNEIDFTAQFSSRRAQTLAIATSNPLAPTPTLPDPCGFCQDGSPCICAEIATDQGPNDHNSTLPIQIPASTPVSRTSTRSGQNPCVNGPGSCAQCLASPTSKLFCKSLAATRTNDFRQSNSAAPVPNGNSIMSAGSATSSGVEPAVASSSSTTEAISGIMTCADTFATLSRHPAFDRASEELGTWIPQLTAVPGGVQRTAFEVEAASVMGVLRFFDRRFGRDI
ncbi:hypothetical protein MMC07_006142 [Pseudocyphellaria aurata]|nr:hypothetical protein [Pseudocyphellaria aurata]